MNSPKVTVIIPCFNQGIFLLDAINSLKAQTFKDWECIIVNDGSSDNTAELGERLSYEDDRIIIINQRNKGLSGARNTGLSVARGKYLQFLDADDMLQTNKLKNQTDFLDIHREIDIVFGDARYFFSNNPEQLFFGFNKNKPWIENRWKSNPKVLDNLLASNLFPVNCPLIRKSVFDTVGLMREDLESHEDWEFWIRCAINDTRFDFFPSENSLALVRMHSSSMTNNIVRMNTTIIKMRNIIGPVLKDNNLRRINFNFAMSLLDKCASESLFAEVFRLALNNLSPRVCYDAVSFCLNFYLLKPLCFFLKKTTPWPIQKLFIQLFEK